MNVNDMFTPVMNYPNMKDPNFIFVVTTPDIQQTNKINFELLKSQKRIPIRDDKFYNHIKNIIKTRCNIFNNDVFSEKMFNKYFIPALTTSEYDKNHLKYLKFYGIVYARQSIITTLLTSYPFLRNNIFTGWISKIRLEFTSKKYYTKLFDKLNLLEFVGCTEYDIHITNIEQTKNDVFLAFIGACVSILEDLYPNKNIGSLISEKLIISLTKDIPIPLDYFDIVDSTTIINNYKKKCPYIQFNNEGGFNKFNRQIFRSTVYSYNNIIGVGYSYSLKQSRHNSAYQAINDIRYRQRICIEVPQMYLNVKNAYEGKPIKVYKNPVYRYTPIRGATFRNFLADILVKRCNVNKKFLSRMLSDTMILKYFVPAFTSKNCQESYSYDFLELYGDLYANQAVLYTIGKLYPFTRKPSYLCWYGPIFQKYTSSTYFSKLSKKLGLLKYLDKTPLDIEPENINKTNTDIFESFIGACVSIIEEIYPGSGVQSIIPEQLLMSLMREIPISFDYFKIIDSKSILVEYNNCKHMIKKKKINIKHNTDISVNNLRNNNLIQIPDIFKQFNIDYDNWCKN